MLVLPSEVAVQFNRNLNRFPFLGQLTGINLDLLLCTWLDLKNEDLFLCLIFTQRPMND